MWRVVLAIVSAACIGLAPVSGVASPARARLDAFFRQATAIIMQARDVNSARTEVLGLARALFDNRAAAREALGPAWDVRTSTERDAFVAAFGRVLETAYLRVFEGLLPRDRPPVIRITGESPAGNAGAVVATIIAAKNGSDVRVDYKMRDTGRLWLVNDVVVDGISVVQNYKAQFERVLRESSFDVLMTRLRTVADDAAFTPSPAPKPGSAHPLVTLYFETDAAELTAKARRDLDHLARSLAADPHRRVVVEGFSDARGTRDRNALLAERRADAVRNYLAAAGIARHRVRVASSERAPVCTEAKEACWAQNRRAVARITD